MQTAQTPFRPEDAIPVAQVPAPAPDSLPHSPDGMLNTVGLALLAYGLVQLLSRVLDRIPLHRVAGEARASVPAPAPAIAEEERRRQEKVAEGLGALRERSERMAEELATQRRLAGQALDELRRVRRQNDALLRRLRGLRKRLGSARPPPA